MQESFFLAEGAADGDGRLPAHPRLLHPLRSVPARSRPGQAMAEMALVIGILFLVVLGGTDLLQILLTNYRVNEAVRASAHQAALIGGPDGQNGSWGLEGPPPSGTIAELVRVYLDGGIVTTSSNATITVTCARNPCRRYDPITVRVVYTGSVWAPLPLFPSSFIADRSATRAAEKDGR